MKNNKLVQINTVCNTSTGRIMKSIQSRADELGYHTISLVGRRKIFTELSCKKFGNAFSFWIHVFINTIFDRQGYGSYFSTRRMVKYLRRVKPDIIHLHNLHGYYLNLPVFFNFLTNEFEGKIFWTFHDCWPFTGHCAYFTAAECNKWQKKCVKCPNKTQYPISYFLDASNYNYCNKKRMFGSLKNLTIIVPSNWMQELVKKSFMGEYRIEVINNGIDLGTFTYMPDTAVLKKYGIPADKKILLGVANVWDQRKGLDDFLELSRILSEDYQIVLVGLSRGQIRKLPSNIVGITRTEATAELVALYSMAHIFINPSKEESFSLVTVESLACGTPVIALNTSAVKELVSADSGIVLEKNDSAEYITAIKKIEAMNLSRETVSRTAEKYSVENMLDKVLELYRNGK